MFRRLPSVLLASFLLLAACGAKPKDETEAIRAGVLKYLASLNMLNLNNMDVKVTQATITGNQAQAQVEVHAKGTDPGGSMQISYALEKRGEEWVVLKTTGMGGGMQHPVGGQPNGQALPAGHPNVGGAAGQPPPDHPNFNAILSGSGAAQQQGSAPPPPAQSAAKP